MKLLLQRVKNGAVHIAGQPVASIDAGLEGLQPLYGAPKLTQGANYACDWDAPRLMSRTVAALVV